jgi:ribonuclease HII
MRGDFPDEELSRLDAMSVWEKKLKADGFLRVAGVDEAGRGPLAGPVVAAACILPEGALFENLNDSKQLSADQRETLFAKIVAFPGIQFGIGKASVGEIDRYNILKATFLAMRRAVAELATAPDFLLIDGNRTPSFEVPTEAVVEGDAKSISIAAASVLAKVTRDRLMVELDAKWPQYGFKRHKGYGTAQHLEAIRVHGPCPIHRKTFDPIKSYFQVQQISLL